MIGISVTAGCELALRKFSNRFHVACLVVGLFATRGSAQATQPVRPTEPVYSFIDRLLSSRLVDTVIVGQRAMSRREIGRIIAEARGKLGNDTGWFGVRLKEYADQFPSKMERAPSYGSAGFELLAADSPPHGIVEDGNGAIAVELNPLLSNRLGQPVANGLTGSILGGASVGVTPWLAVEIQTRGSWLMERGGGPTRREIRPDRFYGRALWKNLSLLAGRDNAFLGQGDQAGLALSMNARAVSQFRLASDRPFVLPGFLRGVGPLQAVMLLGDLGPRQYYAHTRLLAYKMSSRPVDHFEIGMGLIEQVGGQGAPPGTFWEKTTDAFPLFDAVVRHKTFLFSNKFVGVDMRLTVPRTRGLQLYMESAFDDFDLRRARSVFTEDAAYVWGASASCLRECGPIRLAAEYHATGLRYYTHGIIRNGFTVDNQIIGDQLGPRGKGAYFFADVDQGARQIQFDFAYEARSADKYSAVSTTTDDSDFRFVLTEHHPTERRWRARMTWTRALRGGVALRAGAGAERVENFAHADRIWRTNWMSEFGLDYRMPMPTRE